MRAAASESKPSSPARLLADTLAMLKRLGVTDRPVFDGILRTTLESHPRYLGVWSVWEPNALDGRDRDFVDREGHDGTGRYIPFWNRGGGVVTVEPNVHYETPGVGEFYLRPRREGLETVIDPYDYPVAGARRFITTQVAPIFFQGGCVGAAGIDLAVEEIPAVAHHPDDDNPVESLLHRGFVFLEGGRVRYCSARSRRLLARFVGPARDGALPAPLSRLLEAMGGVDAGDEAPAPPALSFRQGGAELTVRPFLHPSTGPGLLLVERAAPAGAAAALSARQHEVLGWMTHGKTNAEIATILGISLHTVKRHVEKILHKLGVPNRGAAALSRALADIGPATYPAPPSDLLAC
jgi:DNA-binding CsgD family transcriptional regulator